MNFFIKKMFNNKIIISFLLVFFVNSCSGLSDAGKVLRNEKIRTTDEFLVKKREPLSLPPDYENLPSPSTTEDAEEEISVLEKTLQKTSSVDSDTSSASSTEESILNKIRKK